MLESGPVFAFDADAGLRLRRANRVHDRGARPRSRCRRFLEDTKDGESVLHAGFRSGSEGGQDLDATASNGVRWGGSRRSRVLRAGDGRDR